MKDQARIGVILCSCGDTIGSILDIDRINTSISKLPGVQFVGSDLYPCSKMSLDRFTEDITKKKVERIVIAGCSPRTHGHLFRKVFEGAGIDGQLVEMVNIREQCSQVHAGDRKKATQKAIALIRMEVARITHAQSREKIRGTVQRSATVIGGGISGMTATLSLAQKGVPVKLVEKAEQLGGLVHDMYLLYPAFSDSREFIKTRIKAVQEHSQIEILLGSQVTDVAGHVGDYTVTVEKNGEQQTHQAGVIIVATGSDVFEPTGLFGYGQDPRVVTQVSFEAMMRKGGIEAKHIIMIQCVGARIEERPYCSRHCCLATIMNAIALKEEAPDTNITVLFRGLTEYIQDFDRAQELGVRFIRYDPPTFPEVSDGNIDVKDAKTGEKHTIPYDLVVLATPLVPRIETRELARMLKIPADEWGFLVEPQTKLRPGEYLPNGVFVAGAVHWPAIISECIDQGHGAASRALAPIEAGTIEKEPIVSYIDPELCRGCGRCAEACPYQAIELTAGKDDMVLATSDEFLCTGCGICASVCPCGAISIHHLLDQQVNAALAAAIKP